MPASSIAAMNSWGVYLISAASLILLLAPTVYKTSNNARIAADWREVDGVQTVINSLKPGLSVQMKLWLNSTDAIRFHGHQISCDDGSGTLLGKSAWLLPDYTLAHGSSYLLTLEGNRVEVTLVG